MDLQQDRSTIAAGRQELFAGDAIAAQAVFAAQAAASPADYDVRYWLASAMFAAGDPQANAVLDQARTLHALIEARGLGVDIARCRTDAAYAGQIADQLYGHKLAAMSGVVRGLAVAGGATDVQSLLGFGLALQHQGRVEEACQAFTAAAEINPSPAVGQFLIYPQMFCENSDARHFAAARAWAQRHAPIRPTAPHVNPGRQGRKLRIGYLAPRFAGCQLQQFMAPLLENHDPKAVSVTLYPNEAQTETGWPAWIQVHPIGGLDDAAAAARIRADGIDVLSDCWGHTAGSRLTVYAHRPAPVQVAWINFVQTTGLSQIDYVLHGDADHMPDGMAQVFCEGIWPIGPVFNAFRPAAGRLPPVATPALATGQVTFGSFNHPAKLSDPALDAWAAALRQAPNARLLLKYGYFADPVLQRVTQARFAARGAPPEQLAFAGHSSGEAYFESFREVDLMFDSWPAPGSTTTLDALSNGVPVLAKPTLTSGGLCVRAILEACGLPELACDSPEDFVARAVALAQDIEALNTLRARVRPGFDEGPCSDEAGFTRRVEVAFEGMFDQWRGQIEGEAACG